MYNYRRNPIKAGLISAAIVSILLNLFLQKLAQVFSIVGLGI